MSYDCGLLIGDSSAATEVKLKRVFTQTRDESPCILILRNIEILARNRDGDRDERVLAAMQQEIEEICSSSSATYEKKKRNLIFLICDTDLSPHSGKLN